MLIKPTRKDIVRAAVRKAQSDARSEIRTLQAEVHRLEDQFSEVVKAETEDERKRLLEKYDPMAIELNAVLHKYGFGDSFKINVYRSHQDAKMTVALINDHNVNVSYPYTEPTSSQELKQGINRQRAELNGRIKTLNHVINKITDDEVISGSINAALNGEAAEALNTLARNIKEVAIGQFTKAQDSD